MHAVAPNHSTSRRFHLLFGFGPRWIRPRGLSFPTDTLIGSCTPIQRQLIGALGDASHPLGNHPENGRSTSSGSRTPRSVSR